MELAKWYETPCLALIWKKRKDCWECLYRLLIPLDHRDIRGKLLRFNLGCTRVRPGTDDWSPIIDGELDTPFRDGAHICWDSERLGLPGYVVFGKRVELIEPR